MNLLEKSLYRQPMFSYRDCSLILYPRSVLTKMLRRRRVASDRGSLLRVKRWFLLLGVVFASGLLTACMGARKRADTTIVRQIKFKGNPWNPLADGSDFALRSQQSQQASPRFLLTWPFTYFLNPAILRAHFLDTDKERIQVYMAHNGYFDAELSWSFRQIRKKRPRRMDVTDIVGHVSMGPVTRWSESVRIRWDDTQQKHPKIALMRAHTLLGKGRRFRLDDVHAAQEAIRHLLADYGYAAAKVTPNVVVRPETQEAEVGLDVDSGPRLRVGELRLHGSEVKRDSIVLDMTALRSGEWYRASNMLHARERLFSAGAFDQVRITPALDEIQNGRVPIDVEVAHGLPRQIRLGAFVGLDGNFFSPKGHVVWSHDNGFRRLQSFEIGLSGGVGYGAGSVGAVPLFHFWIHHKVPRFIFRRLAWELKSEVLSDIHENTVPRTDGEAQIKLTWQPLSFLEFYASSGIGWTRLNLPDSLNSVYRAMAVLGPGFGNQYGWMDGRAGIRLDFLEWVERRQKGFTADLMLRAVVPLAQYDNFLRVEVDVRGYVAPRRPFLGRPVQLLGRLEYREIFNGYNIPYPEHLFLGGASNFRAFRHGQAGEYDCVCVPVWWSDTADTEFSTRRHYLSYGSYATGLASLEVQLQRVLLPELSLAFFGELGSMGAYAEDLIMPENWRVGVGAGIRYDTAIGPFRLDVSTRPIYPEDRGPPFQQADDEQFGYYNCEDVGPRRRPFDIFSEFGRRKEMNRRFPAVNIFVSIGEAF